MEYASGGKQTFRSTFMGRFEMQEFEDGSGAGITPQNCDILLVSIA